ncbi:glycosyltransferase family protein [Spirosoma fluviale]|uniref:Glycosyl transferase family 2 n=1 Tax=Spirosoma fluviale TaxID=1597977 RepID=A0A286F774_9BACT|nr:glycosyltransferase [Spirosoma fluviale]SOD78849.1 Glycosyl transferase family 2 [Spirosoma fluviale]
MPAPVVLFAFKRPHELKQTLVALCANRLASETDLYVFVDGPRRDDEVAKVKAVHTIVDSITGFKSVHRMYSETNIGCANSIIAGVTKVLTQHPAVIVLEDDIVTTPNFLDFMNQSLAQYADSVDVFSVGGYTFPFKRPAGYTADGYFFQRTCAWGWAIWADRWQQVDWELADFEEFINNPQARKQFNAGGSDRVRMLKRARNLAIDAWDIRLCYNEFKVGGYTIYPTVSKTVNIGVDSPDSTTEVVYDRYKPVLDDGLQYQFNLPQQVQVHSHYGRQFRWKFSIPVRAYNKLLTYSTQLLRLF